jgi:hypothetical protein
MFRRRGLDGEVGVAAGRALGLDEAVPADLTLAEDDATVVVAGLQAAEFGEVGLGQHDAHRLRSEAADPVEALVDALLDGHRGPPVKKRSD